MYALSFLSRSYATDWFLGVVSITMFMHIIEITDWSRHEAWDSYVLFKHHFSS